MILLSEILGNLWIFLVIFLQILILIGFFIPYKVNKIKKQQPVSIIIAAWNEESKIKKCVNSILKQNYKNKIEIIVVGGGEDNTVKVCRNLSKEKKIKFIHEKKRMGKWFSLNKGVKIAKNRLLVFLDADCVVGKNWLKNMVHSMKNIDIGSSRLVPITENNFIGKCSSILAILLFYSSKNLFNFFNIGSYFGTGNIVKKSVFKKIKFKKSLLEDCRFGLDAKKAGFRLGVIKDAICYFSVSKNLDNLKKQGLRWIYGGYSEILLEKNFLSIFLIVFSFSLFLGLPFYIYNIVFLDSFTIITTSIFLIFLLVIILFCSIKEKSRKYALYIPYLFFIILFFLIIILEVILRILLKKEPKWYTIQKTM